MEPLEIVVGVVAVAGLAAAGWAWVLRSRAVAELAEARAARASAEQRAGAAEALLAERQAKLDEVASAFDEARRAIARLETEAVALARQHAERESHLEALARTREESLRREREELEKRFDEINKQSAARFEQIASETIEKTRRRYEEQTAREVEERKAAVERLVKPIGETLGKTEERLLALAEQVNLSKQSSESLRDETGKLVRALSRPEIRGRYGEIQLRRVAELAGMSAHCDFFEQDSVRDGDGSLLRPDMIVRLPNDCEVVVDSKCNIDAYLQAISAESPQEQDRHLERFARHMADQVRALGSKKYWSHYSGSPEFVVMFVPGDHFLDAALARRPELLEDAAKSDVILASPATLIGLLRAVHMGWREHRLAEEAQSLLALGKELHRRAATAFESVNKLGSSLSAAVKHFNAFVGSTDRMLMPQLRRFEELKLQSKKDLPLLEPIESIPRELEASRPATED
ncbi:MAG: DNA recombination protein RmuC [Phycisphaerales bacterium JB037]